LIGFDNDILQRDCHGFSTVVINVDKLAGIVFKSKGIFGVVSGA